MMTVSTEKEVRQVVQVAVATALGCWGFPFLGLVLLVLILPWQPIYRMASYLGGVVLEVRARRTVKRAVKNLAREPLHVT